VGNIDKMNDLDTLNRQEKGVGSIFPFWFSNHDIPRVKYPNHNTMRYFIYADSDQLVTFV